MNRDPSVTPFAAYGESVLRDSVSRFKASAALRNRIEQSIAQEAQRAARHAERPRPRLAALSWWAQVRAWRLPAPAMGMAFALLVSSNLALYSMLPAKSDLAAQEVVASHVRALMAPRPFDVESSDRHTVRPWYQGKLSFSPPVADYAAQGFTLLGGRVDYLDDAPVAALVYRRDKHVIDVFVRPAAGGDEAPAALARRGYNLLHWSANGMSYWLASDIEAAELARLHRLLAGI
jgi:anti-sigma factor RsiW